LVAGEERKEGLEETKIVPRIRLSSKEVNNLSYAGDESV
jgi:hypothetical protein